MLIIFKKNIFLWWAVLFLCLCSGAAMFSTQIFGSPIASPSASFFFSILLIFFSLYGFLSSGKQVITPFSIVFLAFFINLSFPAFYTSFLIGHNDYEANLTFSLLFILFALIAASKADPFSQSSKSQLELNAFKSVPKTFLILFFIYIAYFVALAYEPALFFIWRSTLGVFPALFALFALWSIINKNLLFFILCISLSAVSVVSYLGAAFSLGGRINVAAMLLSVMIVVSMVRPSWIYKLTICAAIIPGLAWAGLHRATRGDGTMSFDSARHTFETGAGLGSVLAPFKTLTDIVAQSQIFGLHPFYEWLNQILFAAFFWVPRSWWHEKPEGFGRLMVYELMPELAHTGHSMAASVYGELIFYSGVLGPLFATGLIVFIMRLFFHAKSFVEEERSKMKFYFIALYAYMQAQILTLVWGSLGGYSIRAFAAFIGFSFLFFCWYMVRKLARCRAPGD